MDEADDAVDERERVLEHEPLHLTVVVAAPMRSREERPADLDFAARRVIAVEARRPDDAAVAAIKGDESAT